MRVGFDCWNLSGSLVFTGAGQYTVELLTHLTRRGDIEVFAYGAPAEPKPPWLPQSASWRPVATAARGRLAALTSRLVDLPRLLAADGIDVFHAPTVHVRPSMPPVARPRLPSVVTVHDVIPLVHYGRSMPLRLRLFYQWNLRRALAATRVITVSQAAKRQIVSRTGIDEQRIVAIPHGVDFPPERDPAALSALGVSEPYVLFVGSYEPRKNLGRALDAFERAARDLPHRLVAVVDSGSGHAAALSAAVERQGQRLTLLERVPQRDLRVLYTHAVVVLFPSLAEGFGLPALQAAACGVPLVASDLEAVREVMADAAIYVDPCDVDSIAAGLRQALTDSALRMRVVDLARVRAVRFSWDESAERHAQVYRSIARRSDV